MDQTEYTVKVMDRRLYRAAESGNVKVLEEFRELQDVANEVTPGENTALHIAAYNGSLHFVGELLKLSNEHPEDGMTFVKAKNMEGNTALHEAALGGNKEVVNVLLESCPDLVKEINKEGETALFKACEGGHLEIIHILCPLTPVEYNKRSDGQTPLHLAVSKLSIDVIKKLLKDRPVLATEVDNFHRTPLHMVASIPDSSILKQRSTIRQIGKMLIKQDALSCYKVDQNRQSALLVAVKEGNAALVEMILNYSSDCLEMVDKDGRNALHLAMKNAAQIFERVGGVRLKSIILSVKSERLINCIDNNGQTALDIAVENEDQDPPLYSGIKEYLQKFGAIRKKYLDMGSATTSPAKARKSERTPEFISVSAVLIATVAFAVAFTLPGGIDSKGQGPPAPVLINTTLFKLLVIFDTTAFCYSIFSAIVLPYALKATEVQDPYLTNLSFAALWVALISLSLTFAAAIHLVVASECSWLAVLVWAMVCILPISIMVSTLHGKRHMLTPYAHQILFVLRLFRIVFIFTFFPILFIASAVFSAILASLRWVGRKLRRVFCQKYKDVSFICGS